MSSEERKELAAIVADLRAHLDWLGSAGVREIPPPPAVSSAGAEKASGLPSLATDPAPSLRDAVRSAATRPAAPVAAPAGMPEPVAAQGAARSLQEVRAELGDCKRCKLCRGRKTLVFGVGSPKAELVFVGEGPGEEEDNQGIPFVGKAGQLLTKMIEAMGFSRDEVYICNVVKCRPPGNRNPEPDEIEACEPFLKGQLAALRPKVIVTLGKFAAQTLLRDQTPISKLRGRWREYCGVRLMPTFHPAYLLRSPAEKKKAWEDLQLVMKEFGKGPGAPQTA